MYVQCDHVVNNCDIDRNSDPVHCTKYKLDHIDTNFLFNDAIRDQLFDTVSTIENAITINRDIQSAYDSFLSLIHTEMDNKLPEVTFHHKHSNKRKKTLYKPYWNETLENQWTKVSNSERE